MHPDPVVVEVVFENGSEITMKRTKRFINQTLLQFEEEKASKL